LTEDSAVCLVTEEDSFEDNADFLEADGGRPVLCRLAAGDFATDTAGLAGTIALFALLVFLAGESMALLIEEWLFVIEPSTLTGVSIPDHNGLP
jgi:hypothetical protein